MSYVSDIDGGHSKSLVLTLVLQDVLNDHLCTFLNP